MKRLTQKVFLALSLWLISNPTIATDSYPVQVIPSARPGDISSQSANNIVYGLSGGPGIYDTLRGRPVHSDSRHGQGRETFSERRRNRHR